MMQIMSVNEQMIINNVKALKKGSWKSEFYLHIFSLKYGCCPVHSLLPFHCKLILKLMLAQLRLRLVQVAWKCEQVNRCVACQEPVIFKMVWKDWVTFHALSCFICYSQTPKHVNRSKQLSSTAGARTLFLFFNNNPSMCVVEFVMISIYWGRIVGSSKSSK